jgi:hypothetical protein
MYGIFAMANLLQPAPKGGDITRVSYPQVQKTRAGPTRERELEYSLTFSQGLSG